MSEQENIKTIITQEYIKCSADPIHFFRKYCYIQHPIKGRIPEARHKKASDLLPHEETLYYERMMFAIEIPSIKQIVGNDTLSLTIGGVRSYHLDNLHTKKSTAR